MATRKKADTKDEKTVDEQAQTVDEQVHSPDEQGSVPEPLSEAKVCVGGGYTHLNIRREPSKDSEIVLTIPDGTPILAGEEKDGWCAVEVEGASGFTMGEFVVRP